MARAIRDYLVERKSPYQAIVAFGAWMLLLAIIQLVLEPHGSTGFFGAVGADQIGDKRTFSPFALSPIAWGILLVAGAIAVVAVARTRAGWPAAVTLSTLASPLLLTYMLMGLLPAVRQPRQAGEPDPNAPMDAATAFLKAVR